MPNDDHRPSDQTPDSADTASFQRFMDERQAARTDDGRTFRLLSLLVGVVALLVVMYLLLQ